MAKSKVRLIALLWFFLMTQNLVAQGSLCFEKDEGDLYASENLVEQACTDVLQQSISVANEFGICSATWKCDEQVLSVQCENNWCRCYNGEQYYNGVSYPGCDSSKLMNCFTK